MKKKKRLTNKKYQKSSKQTAERKQKEKTVSEKFFNDIANNTPNSGQF
jgi:hypothetical protein